MSSDATAVNFDHLPPISFTEMDTSKMLDATVQLFEYFSGRTIFAADHMYPYLTALSAKLTQQLVLIDNTAKRNLLRYAGAEDLPHLGALLDVRQLDASCAGTTMRFEIQGARDYAILFPAGTRVNPKGKQIYFATTEAGVLQSGATTLELPVKAILPGTEANGLVPGQINSLVDPIEGVFKVANITTTSGGAEVEDIESYRARIFLAPERFSCAGPTLAYKFHALSARPGLADVEPYSPSPGVVHILLLLAGGQIPDADGPECADVLKALSADKIRPLNDDVHVLPASAFDFDYRLTYYLNKDQAGFATIIDGNIKDAVAAYESWQTGKIGRDINPDELIRACRAAQAKRIMPERVWRDDAGNVIQTEPLAFMKLNDNQVAQIPSGGDRVVFGGLEDE